MRRQPVSTYQSARIAIGTAATFLLLATVPLVTMPQFARESHSPIDLANSSSTTRIQKNAISQSPFSRSFASQLAKRSVKRSAKRTAQLFSGQFRAMSSDGSGVITYSAETGKSHLQSFDNSEIAEYEGEFLAFTPDKTGLITYANGQSWLYTLSGEQLKTFTGAPLIFTPDGQGLLTIDDMVGSFRAIAGEFPLRLYRLDNSEQADFVGSFHGFMPDGQGLVTVHAGAEGVISTLYSLDGSSQATFTGRFVAFTPDTQTLITTGYDRTRLYHLDGTLKAVLRGRFRESMPSRLHMGAANISRSSGLIPDGQGIVTSTHNYTWIYDQEGKLQHTLPGDFWNFTPDGQSIITYRFNQQSWLYLLDGELQKTFEGQLLAATPNGDGFVSQFHAQSQLYSNDGVLQATYEGNFLAFTPDGQSLITQHFGEEGPSSWIHRLEAASENDGEERDAIVLEGSLLGTVANGQWLITCSEGVYGPYRLYRTDGRLQTISRTWPRATPDGSGVIVSSDGWTHIYDRSGRVQAAFIGTFQSFLPSNEQSSEQIVTYSEADNQTRLYDLSD